MSGVTEVPEVRAYLDELRRALADRPVAERDLVLDGVRQHIRDAVPAEASGAQVRQVLEDLGDPVAIAAESASDGRRGEPAPLLDRRAGSLVVVLVLALGGLVVPVAGWVVGVVLLWRSRGWTRAEKAIGAFAVPLVLALAAAATALSAPSGDPVSSGGDTALGPLYPQAYDLIWSGVLLAPLLQLVVGVVLLLRFRPRG